MAGPTQGAEARLAVPGAERAADGAAVEVREAVEADRPAVLELLAASLGWVPDELARRFLAWKHDENPAGRSPAWVALDEGRPVAFRTFVRWEFETADGPVRAVRAVDTATHPDHQGRGLFRLLTLHGVGALAAEGVGFVYNTPNEQSRPGYLKMGWSLVGRVPATARFGGPRSAARALRSRVPADKWSLDAGGDPALEVLAVDAAVTALLEGQPPPAPGELRTRRSVAHLRWRYSFAPLHYRAVAIGDDPARGLAVYRLRRRGNAVEAALCELLAPGADPRTRRRLAAEVARRAGADQVVALGGDGSPRAGFVPLPGLGPHLTWRALAATGPPPPLAAWRLSLGDVELF